MSSERCEWVKRERVDGDPLWYASIGDMRLAVLVQCEWVWGWTVDTDDGELAEGSLYIEHADEDEDTWDYQGVEQAQKRCEAVARALARALAPAPAPAPDETWTLTTHGCEWSPDDP